jgi:putative ABC transport system permease protein
LRTNAGRLPLAGTAARSELDGVNGAAVVVFALADAQDLFTRNGGVDAVYVRATGGTDLDALSRRLEAAAGAQHTVLGATEPPPEIRAVVAQFLAMFSIVALVALGTAVVLVHNTQRLALEERRRQLALVAALGGTGRAVMAGAVGEAALLGLAGGLLGALGGTFVARPIVAALSELTQQTAGLSLAVHVSARTAVVGAAMGLATGALAAVVSATRALRQDVVAELSGRERRAERSPRTRWRRVAASGTVASVGLAGCWRGSLRPWQTVLAPAGLLLLTAGVLVLAAAVVPLASRAAMVVARSWPAPLRLATANLANEPLRTATTAAAVAAAVGVAFTTASINRALHQSTSDLIGRRLGGVHVSSVDPVFGVSLDAKASPAVVDALARLPGVARIERGASVTITLPGAEVVRLTGWDDLWFDAPLVDGTDDRGRFEAGEVLVGSTLARHRGLRAGDAMRLPTRTGFVEARVQGVWQDGNAGGWSVTMSYGLLERLYGPQAAAGINLVPDPGTSADELAGRVRAAAPLIDPDLTVYSGRELAEAIGDSVTAQLAPFWVMQRWLMLTAFVAVLSTMLLVATQRQRDFGLLGAVGMGPSDLAKMVFCEGVLLGVAGIAGGLFIGACTMFAVQLVLPLVSGIRPPYLLELGELATAGPTALAVSALAAALPAWRASRVDITRGLQHE